MIRVRSCFRLLLLAGLTVGLASASAWGQDLKSYRLDVKGPGGRPLESVPPDALSKLPAMKAGSLKTRGPAEAANKQLLRQTAQFYVYKVTQEQYYTGGETGELRPKTGDLNLDLAFSDLSNYILIPKTTERLTADQQDYIREFGAALDEAVRNVFQKIPVTGNPPRVILVNAARMLALAAQSGAPAHARTVIELLTNKFPFGGKPSETPPEVLYYALKAAENLLAAADPAAFGTPNPERHSLPEKELVELVTILNDMVLKNPPVAHKTALQTPPPKAAATPGTPAPAAPAPAAAPATLTPEQIDVVRYFRRQAIRALGKVRFDRLGGEGGTPDVRPAYTLAKVAVSDVSINPPPSVAEVGEAVIGLSGINPSRDLNVDVYLRAIGTGTAMFLGARTGTGLENRTLQWKAYSARLGAAMARLQQGAKRDPRLSPFAAQINRLASVVTTDVLTPIEKDDPMVQPDITNLLQWLDNLPRDPNKSLFADSPQYRLSPRGAQ